MSRSALLEVEDLAVSYGGVLSLRGVSLTVPAEGAVAILGPNGAGKTTLLRAISGLLAFHGGRVEAGRITYAGEALGSRNADRLVKRGVAQVIEGRHVFTTMSVDDNLRSGAHGLRDRKRAADLRSEVLELFPVLGSRLKQAAGLLSGGEQQMLAIGRAMMTDPRLLLLDEPSLGLAPLVIRSIGETLRSINRRGVGILLVEQSSALAARVTNEGYLIDTGLIRASGKTSDLVADSRVRAAYLGVSGT